MVKRQNISSGTEWEDVVGYSRAVRVGNIVEVAGTTAVDSAGNIVGVNDLYTQTQFILNKIKQALHEAGATLNDVVRTRMYLVDMSQWEDAGKAHSEVFRDIKSVATVIEVSALIRPEFLIEIEATALLET